MTSGKDFEVMDYTSDVKIKAYGKTIEELFENSAKGMFYLICEDKASDLKNMQEISITYSHEISYEELLVFWLEKLLFHHETKKMLFSDFKIISLSLNEDEKNKNPVSALEAKVFGGYIDISKNEILTHIKGPAFHDLTIIRDSKNKIFEVNIIFDV